MTDSLTQALQQIYSGGIEAQQVRYQAAMQRFQTLYGAGDVQIFRAPGRVNVIGEHTDYNHGFVLPVALDKDTLLLARARPDNQVRLANLEERFAKFSITAQAPIQKAAAGDWSNYVRGAAHTLSEYLGCALPGFDGLVVGTAPLGVPRGSGVSSSSSLTVVAMLALCHYAQVEMAAGSLIQLCSDAEWYVGTRGGIMDQFTSLYARRDHALFLDCRPSNTGAYRVDHVPLPSEYRILVADSGVHHSNTRNEFNQRVAACRTGVALLRQQTPNITHLRDLQSTDWSALEPQLPEVVAVADLGNRGLAIGDIPGLAADAQLRVRACCRHVWTENQRVLQALDAMRQEDVPQLGELLNAAHASARDDYAISCPEIEVLVDAATHVPGVIGARLTGAGWGGCIIALVHHEAVEGFQREVSAAYQRSLGRTPSIFQCTAGTGAGRVI